MTKTKWTPLTSQEQLDKVWDSMEVGSYITYARKDRGSNVYLLPFSHLKIMSNQCEIRLNYLKYKAKYIYTILTPYPGEKNGS